MIYLINDIRQHERHFWNCLHSIASQEQIQRILDGYKVIINESEYQIIEEEKIVKNRRVDEGLLFYFQIKSEK